MCSHLCKQEGTRCMERTFWGACGKGKEVGDTTASPLGAEWNHLRKFAAWGRQAKGQQWSCLEWKHSFATPISTLLDCSGLNWSISSITITTRYTKICSSFRWYCLLQLLVTASATSECGWEQIGWTFLILPPEKASGFIKTKDSKQLDLSF